MSQRLQQFGRVIRLFGVTFAGSALVGTTDLHWSQKTAVTSLVVGAAEASYRVIVPLLSRGIVSAQQSRLVDAADLATEIGRIFNAELDKRLPETTTTGK